MPFVKAVMHFLIHYFFRSILLSLVFTLLLYALCNPGLDAETFQGGIWAAAGYGIAWSLIFLTDVLEILRKRARF